MFLINVFNIVLTEVMKDQRGKTLVRILLLIHQRGGLISSHLIFYKCLKFYN